MKRMKIGMKKHHINLFSNVLDPAFIQKVHLIQISKSLKLYLIFESTLGPHPPTLMSQIIGFKRDLFTYCNVHLCTVHRHFLWRHQVFARIFHWAQYQQCGRQQLISEIPSPWWSRSNQQSKIFEVFVFHSYSQLLIKMVGMSFNLSVRSSKVSFWYFNKWHLFFYQSN